MEQIWEQRLAETVMKEPAALTPGDIEFLRARKSYLTPEQLAMYADALSVPDEAEEKPKKKAVKGDE